VRNKVFILFICACALAIKSQAQVNLVRNPSFEQDTACPFANDQVMFSNYWTATDSSYLYDSLPNPYCTPDYYNTCSPVPIATIPDNLYFYHYARSGNGMMGIDTYDDGTNFGELVTTYLQGRLYTLCRPDFG